MTPPPFFVTIDDVLDYVVQGHEARERLLDFLCLAFRGCAPAERINAWTGGTGKRLMYAIVTRALGGENDIQFVPPRELLSGPDAFKLFSGQDKKMIASELPPGSSCPPPSNLLDISVFQGVTLVWNVDALVQIPEWSHNDDLNLVRRRTYETRFADAPPHWEQSAESYGMWADQLKTLLSARFWGHT